MILKICAQKILVQKIILKLLEVCNFMIIENIPNFNNDNSNQQQRFITLIDIFMKKIFHYYYIKSKLNLISSSRKFRKVFKRTISRLHELTSIKI